MSRVKLILHEWRYWHISRKTEKFIPWVARKLPKKVKYYVVIAGMSRIHVDKGDVHPEEITGMDLLDLWKESKS